MEIATFKEFLYNSPEGMNKKTMLPSFKIGKHQKISAAMPAKSSPVIDPNILGSKKNTPGVIKRASQLPNPVVFDKNKFLVSKTNFKKI